MTPYQKAGFNELSLFRVINDDQYDLGEIVWLTEDDETSVPDFSNGNENRYCIMPCQPEPDLEELPKDADGFYLWDGGECPVPVDWWVEYEGAQETDVISGKTHALSAPWKNITAFKPISRPDMPRHSEAAEQPEAPVVVGDEVDICEDTVSALDAQEGGDHYKKLKIQPMEYSMANKLDACQHTIIKYVTRFRDKGGIEDLRKAKHCIDMLIEFEAEALEGEG